LVNNFPGFFPSNNNTNNKLKGENNRSCQKEKDWKMLVGMFSRYCSTGNCSFKKVDRNWLTEIGRQKLVDRNWSAEIGRQKLVDNYWSTEIGQQKLVDRNW